ncbi:DNRLRE domain-containing protein [Pedobacter sp. Leaf194]|uniref:CBM96 family carbohydrate-binding protein n=1 Tax=Pedobacter sp. Leaf194 TaxID=1736297 RepID=UPI0007037F6B|nr:DNRLRE domain-containing protein [Pedobacter sp. Leaf194]KQS36774.1 hypothetical protein ASG14_06970 [Pedobacter sp. Leaf194]
MKKFEKILLAIVVASVTITGCKKFALLTSEDSESTSAGLNLKEKTIWQFISEDNFHANDLTKIGLYGKAIERAGLKDLLNGEGEYTVIIPTETSLLAFINSMGYTSVDQTPVSVLKNILQNTIISKKVFSFDLNIDQTIGYPTLSMDSLFLSRSVNATSNYVLTVNAAPSIISQVSVVRSQNLDFKNGVGHVIDNFTFYKPKLQTSDIPNLANVSINSDTIAVSKDSYINNGSGTNKGSNYGNLTYMYVKFSSSDQNLTRRALCQFPVKKPTFNERVGSIKLGIYINRIDGAGSLSVTEDQNINWTESTVNWNNAPVAGTTSLADIALPATGGAFLWYTAEITTPYLNAIQTNKTFINLGVSTRSTPLSVITTKELAANRGAYIVLTSSPVTILKNPVNTGIDVDSKFGSKKITTAELKFEGTESKNVIYTITSLPANGFLAISGIPAAVGSSFTQEQIEKGAIKYLFNGTGNTDVFSLEAKDFQGGFYASLINVNVQVK